MPPTELETPSQQELPTEQIGEQPPSTPAPVGPLETVEGKWGPNSHPLLAGKNVSETLDIVGKLTMAIQQQMAVAPQPEKQMPQVTQPTIDDNLLVTDPAEWRRQFAASVEQSTMQTMQAAAQPIFANQAATAEALAKGDPANKQVVEKWWTEVEQMVAPIPAHMRSKALYDQAARMARANHVDEIATEKAAALANAGTGLEGGSTRPSGSPAVEGSDASWAKIASSPLGEKMIKQYGKAKVIETAKRMGTTLEKYADMIAGSQTRIDPEKPGTWYSELQKKEAAV